MNQELNILFITCGHVSEKIQSRFGNFDNQFSLITKIKHNAYTICDKWSDASQIELKSFDGIIVSGSSSMLDENRPWMLAAIELIQKALKQEVPLLGVCFGHQLLGKACGAAVGPNPNGRRLGTRTVNIKDTGNPLLKGLPQKLDVFVSHRDVILENNANFKVLGTAAHDQFQIIHAGKNAWGVQFHPEWHTSIMECYLADRREILDNELGPKSAELEIRNLKDCTLAAQIIVNFIDICRQEKNV